LGRFNNMLGKITQFRLLGLIIGIMAVALVAAACSDDKATPTPEAPPKEVIRFHDGQWESIQQHNSIAMYISQYGYEYPVEDIQGTTGTMLVSLPEGDVDVNMEIWRENIRAWYDENIANGKIVNLTGGGVIVANGSKGQILETSAQGIYAPTYVIEANPGLVSILDLPDYKALFADPEEPDKGVVVNCILGWACQKIVRAKFYAYDLYDDYNILEPGSAGAIDANMYGAYLANEPFLSYYWEPTKLVAELDLTMLEEPAWTQECQDAIDLAVAEEPYESTAGCAFPTYDVHTGVNAGLVERAPEVTEFLANMFVGALKLGDLAAWTTDNDKTFQEMAIYYLRNNEDAWTTWVTAEAADNVKAALALEE
jgi:glycine betaine/proline transport system substrate-binding protein